MTRNPLSRCYRPAWAVAALAALAVVALTVAPVRSLARDFLGVFRVQEIAFTPVEIDTLPDEETLQALAPEIERVFGDVLAVVSESRPEQLTESEARDRAGFAIRLPRTADAARHEWTDPVHIAMDIDVQRLGALFSELGYGHTDLPQELDGSTLQADLSGILTSYFGTCAEDSPEGCVSLAQMASPTASVPDGLDVQQLGRIYLELLGTPADDAAQLSEQVDWTTTLVVPFPHHVNLAHQTVSVDGVSGTLIHSQSGYRPAAEYLLTWIKGDIIYAVAGQGDHSEALALASSLR